MFDPYYKWLSIPPEEQPANGLQHHEGRVEYRYLRIKVLSLIGSD